MSKNRSIIIYFFTSITLCFICFSSFGQDFITAIDKVGKLKTVTFVDRRTPPRIPIILTKSSPTDTTSIYKTKMEIGLYAIVNLVALDYFMQKGGFIVFEDNSSIRLEDEISNIFLSGGNHQVAIRHTLTIRELKELQTKKIDYLVIGNIKNQIDRFEKEFMRNIFIKIEAK